MIRSCLELFPDAPDGALVTWEEVQALTRHVRQTHGVDLGLPSSMESLRILSIHGYRIFDEYFTSWSVHFLPPQDRTLLESRLAEKADGHGFRLALVSGVEGAEGQNAFRYALREDVDMVVVDYVPQKLKDRTLLLRLLHTASETGHAVIVVGPPIPLE